MRGLAKKTLELFAFARSIRVEGSSPSLNGSAFFKSRRDLSSDADDKLTSVPVT
jgi:hypothetical protein